MASRRRKDINTAHRLPVDRLPIGSPSLDREMRRCGSSPLGEATTTSHPASVVPSSQADDSRKSHPPSSITDMSADTGSSPKSIALAKLQRQEARIAQAEMALGVTFTAERTSPLKGKPADASSVRDGCDPTADLSNQVFSRPAVLAAHPTVDPKVSSVEDYQDAELSDEQGFQIYTGRRSKPMSVDIRAGTSRRGGKPTSIHAQIDEREIREVFGKELPGPDYLQQVAGLNNGQVMFIQHSTGDISAHQWTVSHYEWVNIGQFSNIRKKIEGQMTWARLKGETAQQSLQQNTLAYFRTVAKQREAETMGLPFGPKEIQQTLPDVRPVQHIASSVTTPSINRSGSGRMLREAARSFAAPASPPSAVHAVSGAEGPQYPDFSMSAPAFRPMPPIQQSYEHTSAPHQQPAYAPDDPFVSSHPQTATQSGAVFTPSPNAGHLRYGLTYPKRGSLSQPSPLSTLNARRTVSSSTPGQSIRQDTMPRNQTSSPEHHDESWVPPPKSLQETFVAASSAGHKVLSPQADPELSKGVNLVPTTYQATSQAARHAMRSHLFKLGQAAKERSSSPGNVRTVLHDPVRLASQHAESSGLIQALRNNIAAKALRDRDLLLGNRFVNFDNDSRPASSEGGVGLNSTDSHSHVYSDAVRNTTVSGNRANSSPPCTQAVSQLHAAAAGDLSGCRTQPRPTYDDELRDWWLDGKKFARQEEFYHSLTSQALSHSGFSRRNDHDTNGSNEPGTRLDVTRIFIPILENLSFYVQGPADQRRDYWCRWVPPPEWCIDRGPDGNNSFFDEDWGNPPARIGRDPRYGSWTSEPPVRFSSSASPASSSLAVGGPTSMGMGAGHRAVRPGQHVFPVAVGSQFLR